jgi:hypothetical protein
MSADFVGLDAVTPEEFGRHVAATGQQNYRYERLSTSVIGMAAGMGPIVHLTGGGVLERHPKLRFVVTEAEGVAGLGPSNHGCHAGAPSLVARALTRARQ